MAIDPTKVDRYTTNYGFPIYAFGATRWHEAINQLADDADTAINTNRDSITALDSRVGDNETAIAGLGGGTAAAILKAPTRAEFEALAAANRDRYGGSGFVEWGKHSSNNVNDALWINGTAGVLRIGGGASGVSHTTTALANTNGVLANLYGTRNTGDDCLISFPAAPSDASLLSRQDLVFLEVWHEAISDKDIVYPYGNVQYGATTWSGISLTNSLVAASYSAFGAWETSPTAGYGAQWSTLSDANKEAFIKDPQNNIYSDGGALIQVRYRVRVVAGVGDAWDGVKVSSGVSQLRYNNTNYVNHQGKELTVQGGGTDLGAASRFVLDVTGDPGVYRELSNASYNASIYAVPIALVQRRNDGAYDETYNPTGCAKVLNLDGLTAAYWYETDRTLTSAADCFTYATGGDIASGVSGRPDGLYYDEINAADVGDLRNDSNRSDDWSRALQRFIDAVMSNAYNSTRTEMTSEVAATGATLSRKAQSVYFGVDGSTQVSVSLNSSTNVVTHSGSASTVVYYKALVDQSASSSITDFLVRSKIATDTDNKAASMLIEAAHSTVPTGSTTDEIGISKEASGGTLTLAETATNTWQFAFNIGRSNGKAYGVVNYDSGGVLNRTLRKLEFELPQFALDKE